MPEKANKSRSGNPQSTPESIAHYRILRRLGKGGMGEVFLGEDTRQHGRKVAIKVLPPELTLDEGRVRRFKQEARAVLTLNHPNILTIFEIGESAQGHYIATEFIEGDTLRQLLAREPLELDEALGIAIQVAMALEAAHAEGIIHRDIKPENIMLRQDSFMRDRFVKVLDFGLAKLIERDAGSDPDAVTIPVTETSPGAIIGTSGYMSPEQAAGDQVDARSDIFSLGVVLYEIVARQQPFKGRTDSHTRVSILDHEPTPLLQHAAGAPKQLERIVSKALAKDRNKRYQTITDLKLDLEQLRDELHSSATDTIEAIATEPRTAQTTQVLALPTHAREGVDTVEQQPRSAESNRRVERAQHVPLYVGLGLLALGVIAALVYWKYFSRPTINSVAILPFANDSKDPGSDYLSEGITESIINSLSQLPTLKVMSRNATFRLKDRGMDPQEAGRVLNVGAVLTGRLIQLPDQLVIKTELIKVDDGSQLWGAEYKSSIADIFSVQDEVSRKISESLRVRLTGQDQEKLAKRYTTDAEAYELYLKGRYYWNKRNEEGFRNGIEFFKRAEEKDPTYALAFSGLADSYALLCDIGVAAPLDEMPKAKAAAQKAVDADPTLAEAYTSRAFVELSYDWNWLAADNDFQQAVKLNPKYPTAHQWYASYLMQMGKFEKAKQEIEKAHTLDPLSPIIAANTGLYSYYEHNYDDAISKYKLTLQSDPDFWVARHYLGLAYVQKGQFAEAISELRGLIKAPPDGPLPDNVVESEAEASASLGYVYAMAGQRNQAEAILKQLEALSQRRYVSGLYFAVIYAGLKNNDKAMDYLNRAFTSRHPGLVLIRIEPMFDGLRSDARFKQLASRFEPLP
jgi:serine/threonine protein kinase/Flp pilus assembly protein TadD